MIWSGEQTWVVRESWRLRGSCTLYGAISSERQILTLLTCSNSNCTLYILFAKRKKLQRLAENNILVTIIHQYLLPKILISQTQKYSIIIFSSVGRYVYCTVSHLRHRPGPRLLCSSWGQHWWWWWWWFLPQHCLCLATHSVSLEGTERGGEREKGLTQ